MDIFQKIDHYILERNIQIHNLRTFNEICHSILYNKKSVVTLYFFKNFLKNLQQRNRWNWEKISPYLLTALDRKEVLDTYTQMFQAHGVDPDLARRVAMLLDVKFSITETENLNFLVIGKMESIWNPLGGARHLVFQKQHAIKNNMIHKEIAAQPGTIFVCVIDICNRLILAYLYANRQVVALFLSNATTLSVKGVFIDHYTTPYFLVALPSRQTL